MARGGELMVKGLRSMWRQVGAWARGGRKHGGSHASGSHAPPHGGVPRLSRAACSTAQAAPIVRTTLHGALERIIMRGDVQ